MVKLITVHLILSLALTRGWPFRQLDVNNGYLSKDIFMKESPGFVDKKHPTHVCRLKKALYGLKQAPRAWYYELH